MGMFLWMMPMPPMRAMEMAMADSVTVSMAAESSGIRSGMEGVSHVERSTASGVISEKAGTSKMSSKVRALPAIREHECLVELR